MLWFVQGWCRDKVLGVAWTTLRVGEPTLYLNLPGSIGLFVRW